MSEYDNSRYESNCTLESSQGILYSCITIVCTISHNIIGRYASCPYRTLHGTTVIYDAVLASTRIHIIAQYNTIQYNTIQYNTVQYNTLQHSTPPHSTALHSITQHNTTQHNTTQHNTTQHNTTQHNTTPNSTIPHDTTQHNTTQHHTVFYIAIKEHFVLSDHLIAIDVHTFIPEANSVFRDLY